VEWRRGGCSGQQGLMVEAALYILKSRVRGGILATRLRLGETQARRALFRVRAQCRHPRLANAPQRQPSPVRRCQPLKPVWDGHQTGRRCRTVSIRQAGARSGGYDRIPDGAALPWRADVFTTGGFRFGCLKSLAAVRCVQRFRAFRPRVRLLRERGFERSRPRDARPFGGVRG
jgi:hypothetical protein